MNSQKDGKFVFDISDLDKSTTLKWKHPQIVGNVGYVKRIKKLKIDLRWNETLAKAESRKPVLEDRWKCLRTKVYRKSMGASKWKRTSALSIWELNKIDLFFSTLQG